MDVYEPFGLYYKSFTIVIIGQYYKTTITAKASLG